ncbi:MAG: hypothetical protein ABIH85_02425 [Candidatus Omnitrophota bacterium]
MTIRHNKKLDSNQKLKNQAEYYDKADIEKAFDLTKTSKNKGKIKRVNMILPINVFLKADEIGRITGTGYQNTLKTAIAIGLHQLDEEIINVS